MNTVAAANQGAQVIESVIARGDLSKLNPEERTRYYVQLCQSMGLNPHTQPFAFLTLNGKLTLYAKRDAADQLRKINGISIEVISRSIEDGLFTVHVRAKDRDGRCDEDFGVVALPDSVKGEARANTILKGITKAKRRVTLSISGLGFLDETEVEDIPATAKLALDRDRGVPTARARVAEIAAIPDRDQRQAEAERMHDEWSDKAANGLRNAMAANKPEHDEDGVVWDGEEGEERPAVAGDFEATTATLKAAYIDSARDYIRKATDAKVLHEWWSSETSKKARRDFELANGELQMLKEFCAARLRDLTARAVKAHVAAGERKLPAQTLAQQAGALCANPVFRAFLNAESEEICAEMVREMCDVQSRSEIKAGTPAGEKWLDLLGKFHGWEAAEKA